MIVLFFRHNGLLITVQTLLLLSITQEEKIPRKKFNKSVIHKYVIIMLICYGKLRNTFEHIILH